MSHTGPGPHPAGSGETSHTHSAPKQPLIAVIAIHGVGRHEPGASAQDVATLLTSLGREDNHLSIAAADKTVPLYPGFLTESLVIPLHPVITEETAQAKELHARGAARDIRRLWRRPGPHRRQRSLSADLVFEDMGHL